MSWVKKSSKKLPAPNAKNSKTAYDEDGLPMPDPPKKGNLLGGNHNFPAYTGDLVHDAEVRRAKVETYLIKGVLSAYRIAQELGHPYNTIVSDIEAVQTRWAAHGNFSRLKQLRGEAKTRLQLIEQRLWEKVEDPTVPDVVQTQALMYLQQAHDRRLLLENLTPKTLPLLVTETEGSEGESVDTKITSHANMLKLATALAQYAGNRLPSTESDGVVDADFTEVPPQEETE